MPATRAVPVVPAACSTLSLAAMTGPSRPTRVLAAFPTALYLALGDHHEVLPVVTRDALALPTALRLPHVAGSLPWRVEQGDSVQVGEGCARLPGMTLTTGRSWTPVVVEPVGPAVRRTGVVPELDRTPVSRVLRGAAADLAETVGGGGDPSPGVHGLVGAGAGLTPSGDDAVCGVLLGLRALGLEDDRLDGLGAAVTAVLTRTTSISASLLRAAVGGYALPDVVRLVGAAAAGDRRTVSACLPRVLAVGHSSGADLVAGLLGTLDAARRLGPGRFLRPAPSAPPPHRKGDSRV